MSETLKEYIILAMSETLKEYLILAMSETLKSTSYWLCLRPSRVPHTGYV